MRRFLRSLAMTSRGPSANAFSAAAARHADALMVLDDALLFHTRAQIAELGAKSRLPTTFGDADGRGHPLTQEDQHTSCKVSKVGFIPPYAQPPAPLPVATHAIIDTRFPPAYTRPRDLSEDTTMKRCPIGLLITLTLGLLAAPLVAEAQSLAKAPRIGWLASRSPPSETELQQSPFLQGLRELGWVEGQNLVIEYRWAEGNQERLPELAAELVQLRVNVIVAGDSRVIAAAKQATNTIPIVMTISGDPVGAGFIASLTRPGGNITGLTVMAPELAGKRLELLTAAVPGMSRMAVLGESGQYEWSALAVATQALGIQLHALQVDSPDEFEPAFAAAMREHADALLVLPSPMTNRSMHRIVDLAAQSRLPAMYGLKEYVKVGGLMAYGWSIPALAQRAATYVDKILKGAKPADLPVERPMKFELVINLKTAKALSLTIPPLLLYQADEVIR